MYDALEARWRMEQIFDQGVDVVGSLQSDDLQLILLRLQLLFGLAADRLSQLLDVALDASREVLQSQPKLLQLIRIFEQELRRLLAELVEGEYQTLYVTKL